MKFSWHWRKRQKYVQNCIIRTAVQADPSINVWEIRRAVNMMDLRMHRPGNGDVTRCVEASRRELICGGGAGFVSALVGTLAGSGRTARAQALGSRVPEVDRLAVTISHRYSNHKVHPDGEAQGPHHRAEAGRQCAPGRAAARGPGR